MKNWLQFTVVPVLLTIAVRAAESFSRSLSSTDFSAAGLNRLTPDERAKQTAVMCKRVILLNHLIKNPKFTRA